MSIARGRDGTAYVPAALTAFTHETCSETSSVYQISNAAKRIWDPNMTLILSTTAGVLDQTWMDKGVDYFTGRVKLTATGATVFVGGTYVSGLIAVADIYGWELAIDWQQADTTPLLATWRDVTPLGKSAQVTLRRWRTDTQFDYLGADTWVFLKLDENQSTGFYVNCHRSQLGYTKAVGAADQETVTLDVKAAIGRY